MSRCSPKRCDRDVVVFVVTSAHKAQNFGFLAKKMGFFSKVHKCAFHFHTRFVCQALLTAARLTVRSAVTPKSDCAAAEKFLVS